MLFDILHFSHSYSLIVSLSNPKWLIWGLEIIQTLNQDQDTTFWRVNFYFYFFLLREYLHCGINTFTSVKGVSTSSITAPCFWHCSINIFYH